MPERDPLLDVVATDARERYVRCAASSISQAGSVLWAYGLIEAAPRRALATVVQTASGLSSGILTLLAERNHYGASALLRQLIEAEYLVWLFGDEPTECVAWLTLTREADRARFRPARLRKRAAGRFADVEYWTHCEIGGHPHPRGSHLLPERYVARPDDERRLTSLLWFETAIHLQRFWAALEFTLDELQLRHIVVVHEARAAMQAGLRDWYNCDFIAEQAVTGLATAAATRTGPRE
jgi:hypothetical protein